MRFDVDLSDEGTSEPLMDPGKQVLAEVVSFKPTTTKPKVNDDGSPRDNGSDMVIWTFAIVEPGPWYGKKLDHFTSLGNRRVLPDGSPDENASKTARRMLREFLSNIGAEFDDNAKGGGFEPEKAIGCKAILLMGVRPNQNGINENNIQRVMKAAS